MSARSLAMPEAEECASADRRAQDEKIDKLGKIESTNRAIPPGRARIGRNLLNYKELRIPD
ncbi:hypothetical protein JCM19992_10550 [Thermostilla marina]